MAAKSFLRIVSGVATQIFGVQSSAGAANAGDLVSLDDSGRLDNSMMPVGIGADTSSIGASEALASGDFVNIWDDAGSVKIRKADATTTGKEADGFVLASVSLGAPGVVYFEGTNTQLTGLTAGVKYYLSSSAAGAVVSTAPSTVGQVVQYIGKATSTTSIAFEGSNPINL